MNRFFFEVEGRLDTSAIVEGANKLRAEMDKIVQRAKTAGPATELYPQGTPSLAGTGGVSGSVVRQRVQAEAELERLYRLGLVAQKDYSAGLKRINAEQAHAFEQLSRLATRGAPKIPSEADIQPLIRNRVEELDKAEA